MYSFLFPLAFFGVGEDEEEESAGVFEGAVNNGGGTGPCIGEPQLVFCRLAGGEVGELFVPVLELFVLFFPASSSKMWRTRAFNPAPPLCFVSLATNADQSRTHSSSCGLSHEHLLPHSRQTVLEQFLQVHH